MRAGEAALIVLALADHAAVQVEQSAQAGERVEDVVVHGPGCRPHESGRHVGDQSLDIEVPGQLLVSLLAAEDGAEEIGGEPELVHQLRRPGTSLPERGERERPDDSFPGEEGEHRQRLDAQDRQGGAVSGCLPGQVVEPVENKPLATDEDRPGGPGVGAFRLLTLEPLEAASNPLARPAERALARVLTDRDAVGAGERSHETKSILQVSLDVLRRGRDEPLRESCNEQLELVSQARSLAGPGTCTVPPPPDSNNSSGSRKPPAICGRYAGPRGGSAIPPGRSPIVLRDAERFAPFHHQPAREDGRRRTGAPPPLMWRRHRMPWRQRRLTPAPLEPRSTAKP